MSTDISHQASLNANFYYTALPAIANYSCAPKCRDGPGLLRLRLPYNCHALWFRGHQTPYPPLFEAEGAHINPGSFLQGSKQTLWFAPASSVHSTPTQLYPCLASHLSLPSFSALSPHRPPARHLSLAARLSGQMASRLPHARSLSLRGTRRCRTQTRLVYPSS